MKPDAVLNAIAAVVREWKGNPDQAQSALRQIANLMDLPIKGEAVDAAQYQKPLG